MELGTNQIRRNTPYLRNPNVGGNPRTVRNPNGGSGTLIGCASLVDIPIRRGVIIGTTLVAWEVGTLLELSSNIQLDVYAITDEHFALTFGVAGGVLELFLVPEDAEDSF